ncbi:MAG: VOC family protein [Lachnospiraceae bacterium]
MNISHIMYKVQDLEKAVEEYRKRGFAVEYGRVKNPINALIYFSEGPYIELLAGTKMPVFFKNLFRLFGQGKLVDRLDSYDAHPGGPCGLALENYKSDLETERVILKKHGYDLFQMNSRRNDTKGRKLRFKVGSPNDLQLPFFMTYFNIDPKPKAFVHPNGIKKISRVAFGTRPELFPLMKELCDDNMLELHAGNGITKIEFAYAPSRESAPIIL